MGKKFINYSFNVKKEEDSLRTGFEPVRVTPSDFESDALTTRPSQHIILVFKDFLIS